MSNRVRFTECSCAYCNEPPGDISTPDTAGEYQVDEHMAIMERELVEARRDLAAARELLAEEVRLTLCREYPGGAGDTSASYCIDLTDPDGGPTCWTCRVIAFLAGLPTPTPGGADLPPCEHRPARTKPCQVCEMLSPDAAKASERLRRALEGKEGK